MTLEHALVPLLVIVFGGIGLLLLESFLPGRKTLAACAGLVLLAMAGLAALLRWQRHPEAQELLQGALYVDRLALTFYLLLFICTATCILLSLDYVDREGLPYGEYFALLFLALSGMMVMVSSRDLVSIFLGLEVMSLSVYVLVGMRREQTAANEATLKYFYLGSFSAGVFLYGIALTYGAWGTTRLDRIYQLLGGTVPQGVLPLAGLGAVFMLVGMAFKVAAVPFHGWVPDVYEASPSPLVAFMASAVKASAYAVLLRILFAYVDLRDDWADIVWWLAVLTMFTGNALALVQTNIKRMLAYSSVAHSGYALVALAALGEGEANQAGAALIYYLFAYSFATLGSFGCVAWLSQRGERLVQLDDLRGLGHRYPLLGIVLTLSMLSLIGLPPTVGFFGKYYLLAAAIGQGYVGLAIIVIANSILSLYYYLRVIVNLYLGEPDRDIAKRAAASEEAADAGAPPVAALALAYTGVAIIWAGLGWTTLFGLVPGSATLVGVAQMAMKSLGQ